MKKNKRDKIFIFISLIFTLLLIGIYGYRFIHFYRLEKKTVNQNTEIIESIAMYDHLLKYLNKSELDQEPNSLYQQDNIYYYKGKTTKNYVTYSGILWRILSIDENKKIKLVSEEVLTSLPYGENNDYNDSYINNWLNVTKKEESGILYNFLDNPSTSLTSTTICKDKIEDTNNIVCDYTDNTNLIGLISLYDYQLSGGNSGFINNNMNFVTSTIKDDNNVWYIENNGDIATSKISENHYIGIKTVITMDGTKQLLSGDGSVETPYQISTSDENLKLSNRFIGEYIKYNNYLWRIIDVKEKEVKVAMEGYIKENNQEITKIYSKKDNRFSLTDQDNIGYYLNNDFYNSLTNKDYLVKGTFYIGSMSIDDYNYNQIFKDSIKAYVGLYQIGDMFINDYPNTWTMSNVTDHTNKIIYTINDNSQIYKSTIDKTNKIRPIICFDSNVLALSGNGTKESPYIVGR